MAYATNVANRKLIAAHRGKFLEYCKIERDNLLKTTDCTYNQCTARAQGKAKTHLRWLYPEEYEQYRLEAIAEGHYRSVKQDASSKSSSK